MIHTAEFFLYVDISHIRNIEKKKGKMLNLILAEIESQFSGVTICSVPHKFRKGSFKINMIVDFIKLLEREDPDITEQDYAEIEWKLNQIAYRMGMPHIDFFTLNRLDYRFDVRIDDEKVRLYLFQLYQKLFDKYRFQKKNTYSSQTNEHYKTSLYFNNKSNQTLMYDKEKERQRRPFEEHEYEKNVLRFEVHTTRKAIYNNWKRKGIDRTLKNYVTEEMFKYYMNTFVVNIFGKGDFYKCFKSRKLINQSNEKDAMKKKLIAFLNHISKKGLEGSISKSNEKKGKKVYSNSTYKNYKHKLELLGIHPIPIPKNKKGIPSKIENPLKALYS
ncbi:hypothetical protein NBRC111894_4267 [Sporolactobacillus inulinus]|uniref:Uncharacterized protein n=1 Tax=Sporolactobacillus inulinus TaxID=2078 RepID=A0A4Y1ZIA6_9BACL|nr:hypothetical protein [Sporolactobacillus inulinus]GAY78713.1 hypothetical protein NBRC111894_4267 [Sporolactobacillus inulinus]